MPGPLSFVEVQVAGHSYGTPVENALDITTGKAV
jgi:hypothetical protein